MKSLFPLLVVGAVFSSFGFAQRIEPSFHANTTAAQDGGIFHVATGTWTRSLPQAVNLGPDIIYNNTAALPETFNSGGIAVETSSFDFVDAGRIPSSTSVGNRDNYNVNCIELAYCLFDDSSATGPLNLEVTLYNGYSTCAIPLFSQIVGQFLATGLPNYDPVSTPPGIADCWVVTFDLSGGEEICILGDGDGVFNASLVDDQFGIGLEFDPGGSGGYVGAVSVGPMMAGDRSWTANALGGLTNPSGGGNTYFGPAETCVPTAGGENSSGYDQEDTWWIGDRPGSGVVAGCFFFGGYENVNGCNADGIYPPSSSPAPPGTVVPNAGLYAMLHADATTNCVQFSPTLGTLFCTPSNPNSTNERTFLAATTVNSGVGSGLHLEIINGVPGEFGYFVVAPAVLLGGPLPISNGNLCLAPNGSLVFGRYNVGNVSNSVGVFDAAGNFQSQLGNATSSGGSGFDVPLLVPIQGSPVITPGSTWHFQAWYRDTPSGVGQSNWTNGVSVTF